MTLYQYRAHVGPRWTDGDDPTRYDWTGHRVDDLNTNWNQSAFTTAAVQAGAATTIPVNTTVDFPAAGQAHLMPNGSGETWLYFTYTGKTATSFTGVSWPDSAGDIEGIITASAGARIRIWMPLDATTASQIANTMQITKNALGQFAGSDWTATISGHNIARHAIRNHHLIVIEYRPGPGNPWQLLLLGWLQNPNWTDDDQRRASWQVQIASSPTMAERYHTKGLTAGDRDLAAAGNATASNTLGVAYKERHSGDFTAAAPTLTPAQAIDQDLSTVWIADQMVGSFNYAASNGDPHWSYTDGYDTQVIISLVYLQRPPGYDSRGYRFIELTVIPQEPDGSTNLNSHYIRTEKAGHKQSITPLETGDVEPGEKLIICEDRSLFLKEHPTNAAADFLELTDPAWWDAIDPAGDTILLSRITSPRSLCHMVSWGNATGTIPQDGDDPGESWIGPKVDAPARGEALTYIFTGADGTGTSTTPADYWRSDYDMAPGYTVGYYGGDEDGWNQGKLNEVWMMIELPSLRLYLEEDIGLATDVGPGDRLRIVDANGEGNTQGLPDAGTIQIAYEQISYIDKEDDSILVTGRGMNGTEIEEHNAGDQVLFIYNGIATAAPPIQELKWQRARHPWPENFKVYTSNGARQRTPGDSEWTRDWTLQESRVGFVADVDPTNLAYTWAKQFDPPIRATHVLILFIGMTYNPARPRLNRFIVNASPDEYQGTTWMQEGGSAAVLAGAILVHSGALPPGSATTWATTLDALKLNVQNGPAFSTALDLIDYSHSRCLCTLDSHLTMDPHPWLQSSTLPVTRVWNRSNVRQVQITQPAPAAVKQYKMIYSVPTTPDIEESVVYPDANLPGDGEEIEIGPYIASNETAAWNSCKWRYQLARTPYQAVIQTETAGLDIYPGEIGTLSWDFGPHEDASGPRYSRKMVVESVDHYFVDGRIETTLHLIQIGRRSEG